jgi:hypothetical protein
MRKLLIAGLAVASLTGIVYAQTADQEAVFNWLREYSQQRRKNPPTCVDVAGVTRRVDETTSIGGIRFRCAETFDARLQSNGANWILVTPVRAF